MNIFQKVASILQGLYVLGYRLRSTISRVFESSYVQTLRGRIMRLRYITQERYYWERFQLQRQIDSLAIVNQTLIATRAILAWVLILLTFVWLGDRSFFEFLRSIQVEAIGGLSLLADASQSIPPINQAVVQVLGLFVSAIATVFGLYFALYVVGFEANMQEYSRDVAQFVNTEPVEQFFFRTLLFSLFFNLLLAIRVWIDQTPSTVSFASAIVLSLFSLIIIFVYRKHKALSSRPENVLKRLLVEFRRYLGVVSMRRSPYFRSQYLSRIASSEIEAVIRLMHSLHNDLLKRNDVQILAIFPAYCAQMLIDYLEVKGLLRSENTNWYPAKFETIKRNNTVLFPIVTKFALRGEGAPQVSRRNETWLEDSLVGFLSHIVNATTEYQDVSSKETMQYGVIRTYRWLLSGDYSLDEFGRENIKQNGLFDIQAFEVYDSVLKQYIYLWNHVKSYRNGIDDYLNTLHSLGIRIIDGFDIQYINRAVNFFEECDRLPERELIYSQRFPQVIHDIVESWWLKLDVEWQLEGRLITTREFVREFLTKELKQKEEELVGGLLKRISEHSLQILEEIEASKQLNVLVLQVRWLKRSILKHRTNMLSQLNPIFNAKVKEKIFKSNYDTLDGLSLLEDLDDLVLMALVNKHRDLFANACNLRGIGYFVAFHEKSKLDEMLLISAKIGALAFAYSELDSDEFWVLSYSMEFLKYFTSPDVMIDSLRNICTGDRRFWHMSFAKEAYFQHWYNFFEEQLRQVPVEYDLEGWGLPVGRFNHPSEFIQSFNTDRSLLSISVEDESTEKYIEWLNLNLSRLRTENAR